MVTSYRDLKVWQRAMEVTELLYLLTAKLPRDQVYGLSAQMQRAAVSVPSNEIGKMIRGVRRGLKEKLN
jgi:hypothetical protein